MIFLSHNILTALHGLLHSLDPEFTMDTTNMTPEALQRLSTKISELVGEDVAKDVIQGKAAPEVCSNKIFGPTLTINFAQFS
jgi:hypothetical protein